MDDESALKIVESCAMISSLKKLEVDQLGCKKSLMKSPEYIEKICEVISCQTNLESFGIPYKTFLRDDLL